MVISSKHRISHGASSVYTIPLNYAWYISFATCSPASCAYITASTLSGFELVTILVVVVFYLLENALYLGTSPVLKQTVTAPHFFFAFRYLSYHVMHLSPVLLTS